jgi:hypothetical protein
MLVCILKRLLAGAVTVFSITTHLAPGDPLTSGKARSARIRANLQPKYGLDPRMRSAQ